MTYPRYSPGSHFETCPAATGQTGCDGYPDAAHRCAEFREPPHSTHRCLCTFRWVVIEAGAYNDSARALNHQPRHAE